MILGAKIALICTTPNGLKPSALGTMIMQQSIRSTAWFLVKNAPHRRELLALQWYSGTAFGYAQRVACTIAVQFAVLC